MGKKQIFKSFTMIYIFCIVISIPILSMIIIGDGIDYSIPIVADSNDSNGEKDTDKNEADKDFFELSIYGENDYDLNMLDNTDLFGEKTYYFEPFSLQGFIDTSFQNGFEKWFTTNYPLRVNIVKLYKSIKSTSDKVDFNTLFLDEKDKNKVVDADTSIPVDEDETVNIIEDESKAEQVDNKIIKPKFPQYQLSPEVLSDPSGYKGTEHVIIGKNGYLYENGYINEYLGLAPKYLKVTDEDLENRVKTLKYIQDRLKDLGKAYMVVISPSKAASYPEYIPDFYLSRFTIPTDYTRPYIRFKNLLDKYGVYYVDSDSVYKEVGLTNTFPKTGIHWNKLAAFETCSAMIKEYERQTDKTVKKLTTDKILSSKKPPGYGNPEIDIYNIVYSGQSKSVRSNAILDDLYYYPNVVDDKSTQETIGHMTIQGGSFTGDFYHYFQNYGIVDSVTGFYYNNDGKMRINWKNEIRQTDCVVMEVTEQFVYNMGGNAPSWGENDIALLSLGNNIIDSLYNYLFENPNLTYKN